MILVLMDPLSMLLMSQRCPSMHVESMSPMFSHHLPYALVQRNFSLSRPFLSYFDSAYRLFSVQLLVCVDIVCLSYSTLSSIVEYLVLVDGGFPPSSGFYSIDFSSFILE